MLKVYVYLYSQYSCSTTAHLLRLKPLTEKSSIVHMFMNACTCTWKWHASRDTSLQRVKSALGTSHKASVLRGMVSKRLDTYMYAMTLQCGRYRSFSPDQPSDLVLSPMVW